MSVGWVVSVVSVVSVGWESGDNRIALAQLTVSPSSMDSRDVLGSCGRDLHNFRLRLNSRHVHHISEVGLEWECRPWDGGWSGGRVVEWVRSEWWAANNR